MRHLRWTTRPRVDQPILIAAFEGWNDAGEAATTAVRYLHDRWAAHPFAHIDPEEFYDFTVTRPHTRIDDGGVRSIVWPENRFSHTRPVGAPDVVLFSGIEPQLRWRTYCEQIIEVASVLRARLVVTLGSLLADVAHTRPTSVFGTAYDSHVIDAMQLEPSRYEGPTGIIGVLHHECHQRGINSAALWAAVPSYVPATSSPKAALALAERTSDMFGIGVDLSDLQAASERYELEIDELVSEDEDTLEYVRHLEETHDADELAGRSATDLVDEVERFLREQ